MSVERLGIVDEARSLARRFAERHPAQARRILGEPPPLYLLPTAKVSSIVKPKPARPVEISPEMSAEIALLVCKRVDEVIAQFRREGTLSSIPLDPSLRPSVAHIMEIVAIHADIRVGDISSHRRARALAWPRQVAMTLVKETNPTLSLPAIGRAFGGKDHTTVMHAIKRVAWHIEQDERTAQIYRRSRATIESKWPQAFT